jgi:hypothetical protein
MHFSWRRTRSTVWICPLDFGTNSTYEKERLWQLVTPRCCGTRSCSFKCSIFLIENRMTNLTFSVNSRQNARFQQTTFTGLNKKNKKKFGQHNHYLGHVWLWSKRFTQHFKRICILCINIPFELIFFYRAIRIWANPTHTYNARDPLILVRI